MPTKQVVITGTMTWAEEPGDSGARPEHPIYYPPGIWGPNDPRPTPPIHIPPNPPGIWGGGNVPMPTPPIHLGPGGEANPPGIWGPTDPRPGWGLPGQPPGIWGGGNQPFPTPPIHIPGLPVYIWGPNDPRPGYGLPGQGGGGNVGLPPGGAPIPPAANVPIDGKLIFVPGLGWVFIPSGASGGETEPPPETPTEPVDPEDERGGFLGRK